MPRSMLVYQEVPETGPGTTLIGVHGSGGDLDQLVPLARELGDVRLIAPQAPRPVTPATQGYSASSGGFIWFFIQQVGNPEPATFGEGLWLVEQFVFDVRDRQAHGQPTFLLGVGQGAVLSVTLAGVLPEALAGVVAICGYLPDIPGWSLPVDDLQGLPVLLVHDPTDAELPLSLVEKTRDELARRGASVELQAVAGAAQIPALAANAIKPWLDALIFAAGGAC